jgi:hypothetical protein
MGQLDGWPFGQACFSGPLDKVAQQRGVGPLGVFGMAALMTQVLEEIFNERLHG